MNRIIVSVLGATIFILAAVVILTCEKKENEQNNNEIDLSLVVQKEELLIRKQNGQESLKPVVELKTHYDSANLDKKVRDMAQKLGLDESNYRMFVRQEPDQSQIYRQIGMFVIVDPSGEEYFLPDEI